MASTLVSTAAPSNAAGQGTYAVNYCYAGTYVGVGTNDLSNGTLRTGWCRDGARATTITVRYEKTSGAAITATFGYQWVDYSLLGGVSNVASPHYDQTGSVTISSGETWGARFKRWPTTEAPPNGQDCIRGLLKVVGQGTFSTYVICR